MTQNQKLFQNLSEEAFQEYSVFPYKILYRIVFVGFLQYIAL